MEENNLLIEVLSGNKGNDMHLFFLNLKAKLKAKDKNCKILLDLEDFFISNSFKNYLVDFLKSDSNRIESLATCGVGKGVRKVILQSVDFPIYIADNREDALDWLQN